MKAQRLIAARQYRSGWKIVWSQSEQAVTQWRQIDNANRQWLHKDQSANKEMGRIEPVARWRQWFVGPVPVAVTTVRLVREAEIQLRRPRLHLIPLELRTPSPRPITLVSLQGRLPNLHRLRSPAIHNDSWMLRTRRLTGWRIHSPQV